MSKQQKKRDPLLYIHQPSFQPPEGKMQGSYSLKQAKQRKQLEKKKVDKTKEKFDEENKIFGSSPKQEEKLLTPEEVQKSMDDYDGTRRHEHGGTLRRLKPFKEMNIGEKLDYLEHFPKQLPPVPCIFQTENQALRGILKEKNNQEIVMRLLDKTEVTIKVKDITDIRMIGF